MARPPVMIVGAGIGGLTAALLLAARGEAVTVLESAAGPGGKMRQVMVGGRGIDAGPTVFTMRWVFEQIFAETGASFESELNFRPLETLARHAWRAGEFLDLHADLNACADAVATFAGPQEGRHYLAFAAEARKIYGLLRNSFLLSQRQNPIALALHNGVGGLPAMMAINPFETMWTALGRHFRDPRLRQLFGRYATYCGSSPFQAPATLMLVAHVEQDGVWAIEGGMHALARALETHALRHGATFRYNTAAKRIVVEQGQAAAVETQDGERLPCSDVIFNGDSNALATGLLGEAAKSVLVPLKPAERSLSAYTWCVNAQTSGFPLHHHNVFFSTDYEREFRELSRAAPDEPTVYVCAQDRLGDVTGAERLLVLVNAPATSDDRSADRTRVETAMRRKLQSCGLHVDWHGADVPLTGPNEFAKLFPATDGALYGRATHGWKASFQRPAAKTPIKGLYLAGGSTHPGPGVPMAALSARLAVQALLGNRASTNRFRPMATAGGMSTP